MGARSEAHDFLGQGAKLAWLEPSTMALLFLDLQGCTTIKRICLLYI